MNNFKELFKKSKQEWDALHQPDTPLIYLGTASCGLAAGAGEVKQSILATLEKHNISARLIEVGCIGTCYLEPLVDVTAFGNPRISFGNVDAEWTEKIIEQYLVGKEVPKERALGHFGPESFDGIPGFFDQPMLKQQVRIVLKNCGYIDPENIDHYIANGGYEGLKKALEMSPEEVIAEVSEAGLRGRGGAGFPTGKKWQFCREVASDLKYLICNADEGDPGAFMNRSLLEGDPHAVLEGMLIAAYAIGASRGYIYIRAEYPLAIRRLEKAIEQMKALGFLGPDILGSGFSFEIQLKKGAGAFVCGEETSLIHSIEGKRGMPRTRPPFPAVSGLHGKPTVINNVETMGTICHIIRRGSSWYKQFGVEGNHGTKTFSLVGNSSRTGIIEVPLGTKLRNIIYDIGGGPIKPFKAVQTGGPSGGCLSEEFLDTPVDYESLKAVGSIMGSGGLIVMDQDTCMVDLARYFINFCAEESCGKCTPCRVGTGKLLTILKRICEGNGRDGDIELLERIGELIKATSLCGLGQTAPNPVLSMIRQFRKEFEEHILHKRCSASVCQELFLSPCQNTCPVGMDIPGYVSMIAAGQNEEAIRIARETNPFLSVCGRICDHPCMFKCRRNQLDDPVAIKPLKRFIGDHALENNIAPPVWVSSEKYDEKVAVIGAGPGGLSCAYFLARLGYPVTVFERLPIPGGMLAVGIPEYRLPKNVLEKEIQLICNLGVEIRTRTTVGRDIRVKDLLTQGYKAIFAAVGMYGDRELRIPGEDAPQVMQGVDFLTDVNLGKRVQVGRKVIVIGGGNTAVDAARTALRLGAEKVTIAYRRTRTEMPAFEDEIRETEEEGIELVLLTAPTRIIVGDRGQVTGIEFMKMRLGEFDNKGRRIPVPIENSNFTMEVDTVIPAIGEFADVRDLFKDIGIGTNKDGTICISDEGQTNIAGIFAGGDVASGAATVIKAVASGERAAIAIDRFLRDGPSRRYPWQVRSRSPVSFDPNAEPVDYPAVELKRFPAADRTASFIEVQRCIPPEVAVREAERCLRCDYRDEDYPGENVSVNVNNAGE